MFVVDASVWVSALVAADVNHEPSRQWLLQAADAGKPVVAPALLLAEVAGAVARRTRIPALGLRAVGLVQRLPVSRIVPVDSELAQLGAGMAAEARLRGADAIYVALANRLAIPLVTWDLEQRQRGAVSAVVLSPPEAVAR